MIREHAIGKRAPADPDFRWRGQDVSRLEGISDGVFAITITLLVVSTAAPNTFFEMWRLVKDLPAFIVSFGLIMMAWHFHYLFFRRFGLEDGLTSLINGAFLFLIMFFAYPLKFLCTFLWYLILGEDVQSLFVIPAGMTFDASGGANDAVAVRMFQRRAMLYLYGIGLIGVFGLLALLQFRAYALRDKLELDKLELVLTKKAMLHHLISACIGCLSIGMLLFTGNPGAAGIVYFTMPVFHGAAGWLGGGQVRRARSAIADSANPDGG